MANEKPGVHPEGKPTKKLNLKPRPRVEVDTTQGKLFARHLVIGDLRKFDAYLEADKATTDLNTLGLSLLRTLVCMEDVAGIAETHALTDEVYDRLQADDLRALATGIAKANDAAQPEGDEPLAALGSAMFDVLMTHLRAIAESKRHMADANARIQKTLANGFGGMPPSLTAALKDNLSQMSAIRESLKASPAVEAFLKMQEQSSLHQIEKGLSTGALDAFRKATGYGAADEIRRHMERDSKSAYVEQTVPRIAVQRLQDTPMGRAAIASEESARQLQEVAGLTGQMTEKLSELHTLFLTEVIPQWVKNLADGAASTNTSIGLARKAIYWSIAVTVAMTSWQVWLSREYKVENDKQQAASEALVRQQLKASQDANRLLAEDSARLRDELAKLSQAVASLPKAGESRVAGGSGKWGKGAASAPAHRD